MPSSLTDKNVAILAANGFDENQVTEIQRALTKARAHIKIIAPEAGVVNGWQGEGWGHHFHVDAQISEALGSDFDMLVLPGGMRGIEKLKQNLHAQRIINHFLDANKPVAAIAAGVGLLALGKVAGRTMAAPVEVADEVKNAGAAIGLDPQEIDGNLLTADGSDLAAWVAEVIEFFADADLIKRAA